MADALRAARFDVVDLGSNTPAVSFADAARLAVRLIAVLVGATISLDRALTEAIDAVRAAAPDVPILAGGAAVADEAAALALGADGWSGHDARQAVEAVDGLLPAGSGRRSTPPAGVTL